MADRLVVLDGHALNPGDLSWSGFEELAALDVFDRTGEDQVLERAAGARFVLTNKTPLTAASLRELPDLAYIGVLATGYDVVAIEEANRRGITVTNVPAYGTDSVAQHAVALMLELARQPAVHASAVRDGAWTASPDWCFALTPITELSGKVLAVVGLGRIGRAVARIGAAMGMTVIALEGHRADPSALEGLAVEYTDVDDLFRRADVLTLHAPLTQATQHLVNAARLASMKPSALLVNTSRGPLIDSRALADALERGTIAGAALDVLDAEPPPADHPLLRAPNCIITPHIAWYAQASRQRLMDVAVSNLRAFVDGRPVNTVG